MRKAHMQRWRGKRPFSSCWQLFHSGNKTLCSIRRRCSGIAASECNGDICRAHYWHGVAGMIVGVKMKKWEKKGEDGRGRRLRLRRRTVWGSRGVSGEMLIGLWGAEPQQINSSERITARADIRPPPSSNTHSHLTTHKGRGGGEGVRGSDWRTMCDCDLVCEYAWKASKERFNPRKHEVREPGSDAE